MTKVMLILKVRVLKMNNGKVIAVWGNSQVGKTTFSIKLACELAERKKNVIVICTDIVAPDIGIILPFSKNEKSMGSIWTNPETDEDMISEQCVITKTAYICLLGYKHGENVFSFVGYTKKDIVGHIRTLRGMADYIIVDCTSDFATSTLTIVALEIADNVVRLCGADLKALSFFDSNLSMLADSRFRMEEHIKVLSKCKSFYARDVAVNKYGKVEYSYDYNELLEKQMLEGNLFEKVKDKSMESNNATVRKVINDITGEYLATVSVKLKKRKGKKIDK